MNVVVEWHICEDEDEWRTSLPPPQAPGAPARSPSQRTCRGWQAVVGVVLVGAMALGAWTRHLAQAGLAQVEGEVAGVVEADLWAVRQGRPDLAAGSSPAVRSGLPQQLAHEAETLRQEADQADGAPAPAATLRLLDLDSVRAVVRVDFPAQNGPAYRQTRVYRQMALGWVRTAPSASYWGPPRRLETEHFIFHYYARDAEAVTAAAAKLDALYPGLYAAYFPEPPSGPKVVVQVEPEQLPGRLASHTQPQAPFVVASPAVYLAPETVSDADLLAQAVVLALVDDLAVPVLRRPGVVAGDPMERQSYQWYPLVQGVRLWQLWAQDLPLSVWRRPVVRWALGPLRSDARVVVPEFLPELCAWHNLWMPTPYTIGIPLLCAPPEQEQALLLRVRAPSSVVCSLPRLGQLAPLTPILPVAGTLAVTPEGAPPHPAAVVALATVVEYAAATSGPERILVLLVSLSEHEGWESLVPAVFGVPAAEFEAGWHHYLAEEYGLEFDWMEEVAHGAAAPAAPAGR